MLVNFPTYFSLLFSSMVAKSARVNSQKKVVWAIVGENIKDYGDPVGSHVSL